MYRQPKWCRWVLSLALLGLVTVAVRAAEPPSPLTLEGAVAEAVLHCPQLAAARASVDRTRAEWASARSRSGLKLELNPVWTDARSFDLDARLSQALFEPSVGPVARVAGVALTMAQADLAERRLDTEARARGAWYKLASAELAVAARRRSVELAETVRAAAQKANAAGERPAVDVLRAEVELAAAQQDQADAEAASAQARAGLNAAMWRDPAAPLTIAPGLAYARATPDSAVLRRLAELRPSLRGATLAIEQRRWQIAAVRAQRRPDVALEGFRNDRQNGVQFVISLPLLDWGRISADDQAAQAAVREAEAALLDTRAALLLTVEQARLALEAALQARARYATEVTARAERLTQLAERGYRQGATSILELLDAQRTLAAVRQTALDRDLAVVLAATDLERAIGAPLSSASPSGVSLRLAPIGQP